MLGATQHGPGPSANRTLAERETGATTEGHRYTMGRVWNRCVLLGVGWLSSLAVPGMLPFCPGASPVLAQEGSSQPLPQTPLPPEPAVMVERILVTGSTIFSDAELQQAVAPYLGRSLTFSELQQAANAITQLYISAGYISSSALLPPQDVVTGTVRLQIIEGFLEEIQVVGTDRMGDYVRARVAQASIRPLNQTELEEQLQLLLQDPLFENVEGSLRQGRTPGGSVLVVRVVEAPPFSGEIGFDTLSARSVGQYRLGSALAYRNLAGVGDVLLAAAYRTTTGGSNTYELSYEIPISPTNGTLLLRATPSDYRITNPSEASFVLGLSGATDAYEVRLRQPLVRRLHEEFALSVGFSYENGSTLLGGVITPPTITSVVSFGQDYRRQDPQGLWGLSSEFRLGTGLFEATQSSTGADGQFVSWRGQVQRLQVLSPDHFLVLTANAQLTPDSLLGAEQFFIGGGPGPGQTPVRGYYHNARFGDSGVQFSIEDRITVVRDPGSDDPLAQVSPFFDVGYVWYADPALRVTTQNLLIGTGVGVTLRPVEGLVARMDLGIPLVTLDELSSDEPHGLRVYFDVRYEF